MCEMCERLGGRPFVQVYDIHGMSKRASAMKTIGNGQHSIGVDEESTSLLRSYLHFWCRILYASSFGSLLSGRELTSAPLSDIQSTRRLRLETLKSCFCLSSKRPFHSFPIKKKRERCLYRHAPGEMNVEAISRNADAKCQIPPNSSMMSCQCQMPIVCDQMGISCVS